MERGHLDSHMEWKKDMLILTRNGKRGILILPWNGKGGHLNSHME
jgi:hypothetical protein